MKALVIKLLRLIVILLIFWFASKIVANIVVEILWFQEVNYLPILIKKWQTQAIVWGLVFSISSLYLWINLYLADRWKWSFLQPQGWVKNSLPYINKSDIQLNSNLSNRALGTTSIVNSRVKKATDNKSSPRIIQLSGLLFLVVVSFLCLTLLLLYYIYLTFESGQSGQIEITLFGSFPKLLSNFKEVYPLGIVGYFESYFKAIVFIVLLSGILFFTKRLKLTITAIPISILFSLLVAKNWSSILQYYQPT